MAFRSASRFSSFAVRIAAWLADITVVDEAIVVLQVLEPHASLRFELMKGLPDLLHPLLSPLLERRSDDEGEDFGGGGSDEGNR